MTNGILQNWTENPQIAPSGYTIDELTGSLNLMLDDIAVWNPVSFDSLHFGMALDALTEKSNKFEVALGYFKHCTIVFD